MMMMNGDDVAVEKGMDLLCSGNCFISSSSIVNEVMPFEFTLRILLFPLSLLRSRLADLSPAMPVFRPPMLLYRRLIPISLSYVCRMCIVAKLCKIRLWCVKKSNRNVGLGFRLVSFSAPLSPR